VVGGDKAAEGVRPEAGPPLAAQLIQEALSEHHDVSSFKCGSHQYDYYLKKWALRRQHEGYAQVHVWVAAGDTSRRVLAYFTLSPTEVTGDEVPPSLILPDQWKRIPAILLGKLAIDRSIQGRNLLPALLASAGQVTVEASKQVGGRFLVIDAENERLALLYERFGFTRAPAQEHSAEDRRPHARLLYPMNELEAALRAEEH